MWRAAGLLGDLVLGRLIAHSDAFAVGRKAGRIAPGLQAEFDAPSRRVGKRKYDDEERRARDSAAAAAEKAELRRQQVELPLTSLPLLQRLFSLPQRLVSLPRLRARVTARPEKNSA